MKKYFNIKKNLILLTTFNIFSKLNILFNQVLYFIKKNLDAIYYF